MSDQLISQVSGAQVDAVRAAENQAAAVAAEEMVTEAVESGQAVRRVEEEKETESQRETRAEAKPREAPGVVDIHLRFQLGESTSDLTVFVLDRASKKVLRTIPPEELVRMNVGQLIELFI